MKQTKKLVICSSANFYKDAVTIQKQFESLGLKVIVPSTATVMKEREDFEVSHYKTWFENKDDYHKKGSLMREHFEKVAAGDAILVINQEKHGVANYIGPNVLMEMAIAFFLEKPIFILNDIPDSSPFEEEIKGMLPITLLGHPEKIIESL